MLAWLGRVALELIGQGALGYSFDPLVADRSDTYADALKSLVYVSSGTAPTSAHTLAHVNGWQAGARQPDALPQVHLAL